MHSNKEMLYEYIQIRTGAKDSFANKYFGRISKQIKEENTINLYKDVFEIFLHWSPSQVKAFLTPEILQLMKLDTLFNNLPFPPEMSESYNRKWLDYGYVAHILYPDQIPYDHEALTIRVYKDILSKDLYSFPKRYFDGYEGEKRAIICFRYMVEHYQTFKSIEEYYSYFASSEGKSDIRKYKLYSVLHDVFDSPVRFAHEALPEQLKDENLYHYNEFKYKYKKAESKYKALLKG